VTLLAAVIAPVVGKVVETVAGDTDWLSPEAAAHSIRFGFLAVWIPGLAHVFADMLSAPDLADSIEPLWPIYQGSIGVDLVWYNNPVVNLGLLVAGVVRAVRLAVHTRRSAAVVL
jgi:hypothetical protein